MIITTIDSETYNGTYIPIGRQGEHSVRQICFDLSWLVNSFGEGIAVLVHQRSEDKAPYICQTEQKDNRLIWNIDEIDTAYVGIGIAEIRWTVNNALAKTVLYKTSVLKSITADTVIPTPYKSWYDKMMEQIKNVPHTFKRPFRFIQISDTHYGSEYYYNLRAQERMNRMINWIIEEHKRKPVDFVIHTGDISYLNLFTDGKTNYISKFYKEFISKLPCPVYSLAGNHDGYTNDQFINATGTPRQYTVEFGDIVLVMLDTFSVSGSYVGGDASYLQSVLDIDAEREKKFILFAHSFYRANDSDDFKDIVDRDERILYLVMGHTHKYSISAYGSKTLVIGGNIAFWMGDGVKQMSFNADLAWGYVVHELTDAGIKVKHVQPEGIYYYNNESTEPIVFDGAISEQTLVASGKAEKTYDFSVERDWVNNHYYDGLQKTDSVYTLNDVNQLDWGTDLDDIRTIGVYGSESAVKTKTLSHVPFDQSGFKLVVERITNEIGTPDNSRYLRQVIFSNMGDVFGYFRIYNYVTGWGNWREI